MTKRKLRQLIGRAETIAHRAYELKLMIVSEFGIESKAIINDIQATESDAWEVYDRLKGHLPLVQKRQHHDFKEKQ